MRTVEFYKDRTNSMNRLLDHLEIKNYEVIDNSNVFRKNDDHDQVLVINNTYSNGDESKFNPGYLIIVGILSLGDSIYSISEKLGNFHTYLSSHGGILLSYALELDWSVKHN